MCGIGGIVGGKLHASARESAALRLQAALAHRGPDGDGLFRDPRCLLVHTRLAILDPTRAGLQPMQRGPLTLTFNGEIYDFQERRAELQRMGIEFQTNTDTEVLLHLYAREGEACFERLRGMFALAIWDAHDGSCLLARDPFGIKPLYYAAFPGGGLVFASEVRAILASGLVARKIDAAGLHGFLATGSVPEPATMVAGVKCLEAGQTLRWTAAGTVTRPYFEIRFPDDTPEASAPPNIRASLDDAVAHHLVSDVPVGLLLSGGVDSSALLALIKAAGHNDVATFSLGVEDTALDESGPARALARHFGARHHEMLLTQELARHWIDDFLDAVDQPTLDGFNTYCACKLARDHDCKVVLSGLGADELFGGYPSFQQVPRLHAWAGALPRRPLAVAARTLARIQPDARTARACGYLDGDASLTRAYGAFRGVFADAEIESLLTVFLGDGYQLSSWESHSPEQAQEADEISRLELTRYLRNQLLRDADVMSMAHGVELRVPLLDVPLFEKLRAIPPAQRLHPQKRLLRDAVPELPAGLLAARKRAFGLPFASWLEHEWADLSADLPALPRLALQPWYRRWSLIVLVHWLKRHGLLAG